MGTRGLTMVISGGKTRIAQYGQWDHYPSGQGTTILKFLSTADLEQFRKKLKDVKFAGKKQEKEWEAYYKEIGADHSGFVTMEQAKKFSERYPLINRDNGGKILQMVAESGDKPIYLIDKSGFAGDSLFCEWAYVVDMDNEQLEVYKGFNQSPLPEGERFKYLEEDMKRSDSYYPVKHVASFGLRNLPEVEEFILLLEPKEEEV